MRAMDERSLLTRTVGWLLVPLAVVATLTKSSYACCSDKPVVEDSCYVGTTGTLDWNPPQSCSDVNSYEVLYTKANCSTSDAKVERILTNETTVFMTSSSDVYCIRVRAVLNKNCYSHYSTCAQVASLEKDQVFNVAMNGEICIPVRLCQQNQTSKIVLRNTHFHLTWGELELRHNVNRKYDNRTGRFYYCFPNVTEDFLFVEYCDVIREQPCESVSTSCCSFWAEFVSRTHVNVTGNRDVGCSDLLLLAIMHDVLPPTSRFSTTPDAASITQSGTSPYTSMVASSTSGTTPSTPPDDNLPIVLSTLLIAGGILTIIGVILLLLLVYHKKRTTSP